jgi:hypothetical protein
VNITASGHADQARIIDLMAKVHAAGKTPSGFAVSGVTGWPQKGQNISVSTAMAGRLTTIQGTVVALEPRTAVSAGRMVVQDNTTGALVELPAPAILD